MVNLSRKSFFILVSELLIKCIYPIIDITEVNGLSVDWLSRHLYWTDSRKHTIEMADYDGNNRRVLLDTLLYIPRSIHVDSQHG